MKQNNLKRQIFFPFYRWEMWGSEKLCSLPKSTVCRFRFLWPWNPRSCHKALPSSPKNTSFCVLMCWQMFNNGCLFWGVDTVWTGCGRLLFAVFSNFSGVNTAVVNFKLPMWYHWMRSWEEMCGSAPFYRISIMSMQYMQTNSRAQIVIKDGKIIRKWWVWNIY